MTAVRTCDSCGARVGDVAWCSQCFVPLGGGAARAQPDVPTFEALPTASWAMPAGAVVAAPPVVTAPPAEAATRPRKPSVRRNVRYATWWQRVKAKLVDELLCLGLSVALLYVGAAGGAEAGGVVLALMVLNDIILQGLTGHTIGKRVVGIQTVRERDLATPGMGRCTFRTIVSFVNGFPAGLGYLSPIFDKRSRTYADMAARTIVIS